MKVIILAAGQGKRISELTKGEPKCLLKIGEESVLEREIRILSELGISKDDIYVIGGYKYDRLKPYANNIIKNDDYNTKENSYSLLLGLEETIGDDVLVLDADICFEKELIHELLDSNYKNAVVSMKSNDLSESTGVLTNEKHEVEAIGKNYNNTGYVYLSIFKLSAEACNNFVSFLREEESMKTWYTYAMTKLSKVEKIFNIVTSEKWHEIDFIDDYYETLEMFNL